MTSDQQKSTLHKITFDNRPCIVELSEDGRVMEIEAEFGVIYVTEQAKEKWEAENYNLIQDLRAGYGHQEYCRIYEENYRGAD